MSYTDFLICTCPFLLIGAGVISNLIILLVFMRRQFEKASYTLFLSILASSDILSIITLLPYNLKINGVAIIFISNYTCKIFDFLSYALPANSSWLLALISIERLVSIKFTSIRILKVNVFAKLSICVMIFAWNLAIYTIRLLHISTSSTDDELFSTLNTSTVNGSELITCGFSNLYLLNTMVWVDMVNSTLMPFAIMIVCSILIIREIFISRFKAKNGNSKMSKKDLRKHKKDIQFSATILSLNVVFFLFNLPVCIINFFFQLDNNDPIYLTVVLIFYSQYTINFLIYLLLNTDFKMEFFRLICCIHSKKNKLEQSSLSKKN